MAVAIAALNTAARFENALRDLQREDKSLNNLFRGIELRLDDIEKEDTI